MEQKESSSLERWQVEGQGLRFRAAQAVCSTSSSVALGKAFGLLT